MASCCFLYGCWFYDLWSFGCVKPSWFQTVSSLFCYWACGLPFDWLLLFYAVGCTRYFGLHDCVCSNIATGMDYSSLYLFSFWSKNSVGFRACRSRFYITVVGYYPFHFVVVNGWYSSIGWFLGKIFDFSFCHG